MWWTKQCAIFNARFSESPIRNTPSVSLNLCHHITNKYARYHKNNIAGTNLDKLSSISERYHEAEATSSQTPFVAAFVLQDGLGMNDEGHLWTVLVAKSKLHFWMLSIKNIVMLLCSRIELFPNENPKKSFSVLLLPLIPMNLTLD